MELKDVFNPRPTLFAQRFTKKRHEIAHRLKDGNIEGWYYGRGNSLKDRTPKTFRPNLALKDWQPFK